MKNHVHHAHLFATDINASLKFYQEMFGGEIVADLEMAGSRNVFLTIGQGRLHFYDQPPREQRIGTIHHLGIETDDLDALVTHMRAKGMSFRKGITDFGFWKYVMVMAPDNVLLELFQIIPEKVPVGEYQKLKRISLF
jgi:catechol 2,3-dioxygenase-like lactoylglutathione lyase family enzyme